MRRASDDLPAPDRALLSDVDATGLHVVHVPGERGRPEHSYTVGMWESFGQPEVLVFGLPAEVAAELLEAVADDADAGERRAAEVDHHGLLESYPVRFLGLAPEDARRWLPRAAWAYDGEPFEAAQLVWPDKQGRWPWDPAARDGFRASQPTIGRRTAG